MSCSNHAIELENTNFGESFTRRIFIFFGHIKNPCECESVEIKRTNDGSSYYLPLNKKFFKYLVRLLENCDNFFELKYCNTSLKIHLQHKSIDAASIYDIQPLYIINKCGDGKFQTTSDDTNNGDAEAALRINLALELTQCVISSKLNENQFGEKSFVLRKCKIFHSDLDVNKARPMNQWDLYDAVARELVEKEKIRDLNGRRKFVAFLSCTKFEGLEPDEEYSYANIKAKTFANPALGGGFLCLMGSGCFYSWPSKIEDVVSAFASKRKVDLSQVLDDSNYRLTYGGTFATSLGSLIHEMGHIFDLAHTETGLMGNDVDFIHRFFLSENFTEILPKRNVRNCQLMQELLDKKSATNQRLTKIKKPGGLFLEKYYEQKDSDMTFFEANCLITLWCHRWFTQCDDANNALTYCESSRTVKSEIFPLRLVELRELAKNNSVLIKYWSLMERDVLEFKVPLSVNMRDVVLFAITSNGAILKRDIMQ